MSKELTEQWRNGTLPEGYYYIVANTKQKHNVVFYLPERNTEDELRLDLKDGYVLEVLAPVPTYDQFSKLVKNVEGLKQQLEYSERTLKNIRILMTCDPSDMKETDENFCADQLALETINGYFEKFGVEK